MDLPDPELKGSLLYVMKFEIAGPLPLIVSIINTNIHNAVILALLQLEYGSNDTIASAGRFPSYCATNTVGSIC